MLKNIKEGIKDFLTSKDGHDVRVISLGSFILYILLVSHENVSDWLTYILLFISVWILFALFYFFIHVFADWFADDSDWFPKKDNDEYE